MEVIIFLDFLAYSVLQSLQDPTKNVANFVDFYALILYGSNKSVEFKSYDKKVSKIDYRFATLCVLFNGVS